MIETSNALASIFILLIFFSLCIFGWIVFFKKLEKWRIKQIKEQRK